MRVIISHVLSYPFVECQDAILVGIDVPSCQDSGVCTYVCGCASACVCAFVCVCVTLSLLRKPIKVY